jgi:hypothetical protein
MEHNYKWNIIIFPIIILLLCSFMTIIKLNGSSIDMYNYRAYEGNLG